MSSIERQVGNAGRAPRLRKRPSTSSATSRRSAPSFTSPTACSRASREIRPARSRDSRAEASMALRSRRKDPLPKDLWPIPGEVDDRRLAAERRRASVQVDVDTIAELLVRLRARDRGRPTMEVRARRGDGAVRLREEARDRVGRDADRDPAVRRDDRGGRVLRRPQDDREGTREVLRAERLGDCRLDPKSKHVGGFGEGDGDRLIPGTAFRGEDAIHGLPLERIRSEPVHRVRRMHDEPAGPQGPPEAVERRGIEDVLRAEGLRHDRNGHSRRTAVRLKAFGVWLCSLFWMDATGDYQIRPPYRSNSGNRALYSSQRARNTRFQRSSFLGWVKEFPVSSNLAEASLTMESRG